MTQNLCFYFYKDYVTVPVNSTDVVSSVCGIAERGVKIYVCLSVSPEFHEFSSREILPKY